MLQMKISCMWWKASWLGLCCWDRPWRKAKKRVLIRMWYSLRSKSTTRYAMSLRISQKIRSWMKTKAQMTFKPRWKDKTMRRFASQRRESNLSVTLQWHEAKQTCKMATKTSWLPGWALVLLRQRLIGNRSQVMLVILFKRAHLPRDLKEDSLRYSLTAKLRRSRQIRFQCWINGSLKMVYAQ